MAQLSRDHVTVFVPRWRLFSYRAAGWSVRGSLVGDFLELEWRRPGNPVFLSPVRVSAPAGACSAPQLSNNS